jgi:NAD dependent epimerase/dehydratase family enzyme
MRTVSEVMGRPFFFPAIPSFLFRILYGEMSSILLQGTRVSSEKIISSGYSFRYPDLRTALISLL